MSTSTPQHQTTTAQVPQGVPQSSSTQSIARVSDATAILATQTFHSVPPPRQSGSFQLGSISSCGCQDGAGGSCHLCW